VIYAGDREGWSWRRASLALQPVSCEVLTFGNNAVDLPAEPGVGWGPAPGELQRFANGQAGVGKRETPNRIFKVVVQCVTPASQGDANACRTQRLEVSVETSYVQS
jgi:hypothetical protein